MVQTASKPLVRTNVVTNPSSKPAAKLSMAVEYNAVRDPSHRNPLQGYKRSGATNTTQVSLILPLLPAVSRYLEELFPTARKWSRPAEPHDCRSVLLIGPRPLHDLSLAT